MAALKAAPLTAMLVEGNRAENCRGIEGRRFLSARPFTTPELGLLRCRIGNAGRDNSGRHGTKVAVAAASASATCVVAVAGTIAAIRDMTDALRQQEQEHDDREMIEQEFLDMIENDDESMFCDVLTRSQSCQGHHYASQSRTPAEKRSSKVGVESKKPMRLGSASWDLLD